LLCGCETCSLTAREERTLRTDERKVLWKISEPSRNEVSRDWRKLLNEELHNLYSSAIIIGMMKSRKKRSVERASRMMWRWRKKRKRRRRG
jgi:hypothetical protein